MDGFEKQALKIFVWIKCKQWIFFISIWLFMLISSIISNAWKHNFYLDVTIIYFALKNQFSISKLFLCLEQAKKRPFPYEANSRSYTYHKFFLIYPKMHRKWLKLSILFLFIFFCILYETVENMLLFPNPVLWKLYQLAIWFQIWSKNMFSTTKTSDLEPSEKLKFWKISSKKIKSNWVIRKMDLFL